MNDNVYISSSCVRTEDIARAAGLLAAHVSNIELSGGGCHDAGLLGKLKALKREKGLNFLVHSYFPPPPVPFILNFADTGEKTRSFIDESMRFVQGLDCPYYSVHAGFRKEFTLANELLFDSESKKTYGMEGVSSNARWFEEKYPGKKLAIENLYPNNGNPESCLLMHIEEISGFMDEHSGASLLLDLGHLQISARMLGFDCLGAVALLFGRYGKRIAEIHLSENDLMKDDHFLVGKDSNQYGIVKEYAGAVRECGIKLTIEARNAGIEDILRSKELINEAVG